MFERTRTYNLLIRSQMLYPIELQTPEMAGLEPATPGFGDQCSTNWATFLIRVEGIEPSSSGWKPNRLPLTYTRIINRNGVIRTRDPLLPKQMRYQAALRSEWIPLTGIEPVPLPRKGNVLTTRRKGLGESRIRTYVNKCCLIYSQMPLTTQPSFLYNIYNTRCRTWTGNP